MKKKLTRKFNHDGVDERFEDPAVRKSVEVNLVMIQALNGVMRRLEWQRETTARQHDYHSLYLLRSNPGVGQFLALVILCEVHDIYAFLESRIGPPMPASSGRPKSQTANGLGIRTRKQQPSPEMGHQGSGDNHAQGFAANQIVCVQPHEVIQ